MSFLPALGQSDFRALREAGFGYVDKTAFVAELLADPTQVVLFARPRRCGKTLFLSTLGYFLEQREEDLSHLFQSLAVWNDPAARAHYQQYPALFLTFKDVKAHSYAEALEGIRLQVKDLYRAHRYLLDGGALHPAYSQAFERILSGEGTEVELQRSLKDLSDHLARRHGRKVVILIDEYDTPIQCGYLHGFFDEVTLFFRNFFSAALKDNPSLFKGVLTGVLRVSRENLFSGLNNVIVRSLLHERERSHRGSRRPARPRPVGRDRGAAPRRAGRGADRREPRPARPRPAARGALELPAPVRLPEARRAARRARPGHRLPRDSQPGGPGRLPRPVPALATARLAGAPARGRAGPGPALGRRAHAGGAAGADAADGDVVPGPGRPRA